MRLSREKVAEMWWEGSEQDGRATQGESETPAEDGQGQVWWALVRTGWSPECVHREWRGPPPTCSRYKPCKSQVPAWLYLRFPIYSQATLLGVLFKWKRQKLIPKTLNPQVMATFCTRLSLPKILRMPQSSHDPAKSWWGSLAYSSRWPQGTDRVLTWEEDGSPQTRVFIISVFLTQPNNCHLLLTFPPKNLSYLLMPQDLP